ncbi:MAG: hypothetical protein ABIQ73_28345 [Acidimicrobiales bacterium]
MSNEVINGYGQGRAHTRVVTVPTIGPLEFTMRRGDRRAGRGFALIEARDGVEGGYALVRNYGRRRTVVAVWLDHAGTVRTWVSGPVGLST